MERTTKGNKKMNKIPRPRTVTRTFWERVTKTPECWIWKGYTTKLGYGLLTTNSITTTAHRFSWELLHGPIPLGLNVLHKCDNPPCVRPDHLFLGTQWDNIQDMIDKERQQDYSNQKGNSRNSSKLTEHQVEEIKVRLSRESGVHLARRFGVTRQCINLIKLGRTHLT